MAQIDCGIINGQAVGDGPQVQGVAGAVALEAMERVGVGVNAETACGSLSRAVQGTGAALLAGVVRARHEAQEGEHLGDGEGGPHGGEVDGGAWRIRACLDLFVAGLPQLFAAFAGLGELAVAFGVDGFVVAEELVVGRDIADGPVPSTTSIPPSSPGTVRRNARTCWQTPGSSATG